MSIFLDSSSAFVLSNVASDGSQVDHVCATVLRVLSGASRTAYTCSVLSRCKLIAVYRNCMGIKVAVIGTQVLIQLAMSTSAELGRA